MPSASSRSPDQHRAARSNRKNPAASAGSMTGRPISLSDASSCQPRNHRASASVSGAVSRHHSRRLAGSMWSGTWPQARSHCSGGHASRSVAGVRGARASAVRRQGPIADPSALAGKDSRPDAETASARGGSRRVGGRRRDLPDDPDGRAPHLVTVHLPVARLGTLGWHRLLRPRQLAARVVICRRLDRGRSDIEAQHAHRPILRARVLTGLDKSAYSQRENLPRSDALDPSSVAAL